MIVENSEPHVAIRGDTLYFALLNYELDLTDFGMNRLVQFLEYRDVI